MSKYAPLVRFLRRQRRDEVDLSFRDIERIITDFLPKASADPAWWRVDGCPTAPAQQRAFAQSGFIPEPAFHAERVRFRRAGDSPGSPGSRDDPEPATPADGSPTPRR